MANVLGAEEKFATPNLTAFQKPIGVKSFVEAFALGALDGLLATTTLY